MAQLLASDRTAQAKIVLPQDPTPQELYAAQELRDYLDLMSSAVFEIVRGPVEDAQIALGRAALDFVQADESLGEDGFLIETQQGVIAIWGGKRGLIYGVYELLEQMGCRFFTATCEKVPCETELPAPELHIRQKPVLEYRDHNYYEFVQNPRFAVKARINGQFPPIKEKFGGHLSYTWFVHTFEQLVPTEVYGQSHPEYFAMYDGKRKVLKHQSQLCLSNPEVLKIAIESARAALRAHPETRIISISQNDFMPGCQCSACLKIDEEEGSPAGLLLRFVNAVAQALEEEFPEVIFDTLAYQYTRPVPRITHPRHNVCVRLCSIECCFAHPFETCDDDRSLTRPDGSKSSFVNDLREWGAFHDRLYIWDYTTCFAHYPAPFPNWRTLQPNMQAFVKNNVKGVFEQANGAKKGGVDFNELRAYVISKLLWDADTDVQRHIQEFTDYYYGAAGPYVREYIDALCDKAEREDIHAGFNDSTDTPLYSEEMLDLLDGIMDKAERAVQGDALRLWRIGKARLSVRYVRMKNNAMLKNQLDPEQVNQFFTDWRAYGLSRIDEWVSMQTTHRALLKNVWRGTEFYPYWNEEGEEEF